MTRSLVRLALPIGASAAAVYLVPASVHIVAWPASGPVRMALVPPARLLLESLLVGVLAAAVCVAVVRARGGDVDRVARSAAPLALLWLWTVPFLPSLPDHAPLLLVLAGPLRWVVCAVAVGWSLARAIPGLALPHVTFRRATVFVISLALYLALGLRFTAAAGFGGDEPHYLIITHSLLVDHDLDIANNHEHRDYRAFYGGELRPDYLQRSQDGRIYSIHAPGLPVLLVPAYAIARANGAVVTMALLAALMALAIFDLAALLAGPAVAIVVWIATCFTVPILPHAWLVYPELAGACIVAWSALWMIRDETSPSVARSLSWASLLWQGVMVAALPWLHTKFVVLLACIALVQLVRLWPRIRSLAIFGTPIAISLAAWFYFFFRTYGTLDPEAPYGSSTQLNVLASNIPHGLLGLLFDQKFGLLVFSPVYALTAVGLVIMWRDVKLRSVAVALTFAGIAFLLSTTRFYMWWGGSSAPARFLVPVLPLCAPAIAVAIDRWEGIGARAFVTATVGISVLVAAACMISPRAVFLFNDPHGLSSFVQAIQGAAPLDRALPTFTEEHWHAAFALLVAWLAAFGVAAAVAGALARSARVTSAWAAAALTLTIFGAVTSAFEGGRITGRDAAARAAIVSRGQTMALAEYDAARVRAVDLARLRREDDAAVRSQLTLSARATSTQFDLPEGEYEARVWFSSERPRGGELRAQLSDRVILAATSGPLTNPATVRFRMAIPAGLRIALTDPEANAAVQRVELAPLTLAAGAARSGIDVRAIDPIDGRPGGYMAYLDDRSYPEGGVFWTRDTDTSRLVVVPAGAGTRRRIVHVGPTGGKVAIDAAARHLDVDLAANDTDEILVPLPPGAATVPVTIGASRSFRPADADPASDDQRRLGCQVRPRLE